MFFNSLEYALFLPCVFGVYWLLGRNYRLQNLFLFAVSYFFYGWWDYRFVFLLLFSTLLDFFTGLQINAAESQRKKRFWLWLSVVVNVGFLGFFKYYNFFADSLAALLSSVGIHSSVWTLNIILPVGISFYTFHGLSYVIDIYYGRTHPTTNFIEYAVFVSFFPLLVAGPIERATHLLPQIQKPRYFAYAKGVQGLRLILWGCFKKIVVADNCSIFVNAVFGDYRNGSRENLILGVIFFSFQIYGDFSGYSDIARGTAKLLGVDLITNFKTPYFARDIAEFWRRWHISLTTWFRDYVYIPLGGSKLGRSESIRNTFVVFLISGFWHGANWTFIFWGFLNALYFLPLLLSRTNRVHLDTVAQQRAFPTFRELGQMLVTFLLVSFSWVFFRSDSLSQAFDYLSNVYKPSGRGIEGILVGTPLLVAVCLIGLIFDWLFRRDPGPFELWDRKPFFRYASYVVVILLILFYGSFLNPQAFIYFQF